MQGIIQSTLNGLVAVNVVERGMSPAAQQLIRTRIDNLQALLMDLNQLIHGKLNETATIEEQDEPAEDVQSQEEIDKLFD